jgi:hypothetical protein
MRAVLTRQFRSEDVDPAKGEPDAVIASLSELLPFLDGLQPDPVSEGSVVAE